MPAIVQQIDRLPLVEKMQLVQHLLQSLSNVIADNGLQEHWQMPQKSKRIGLMEGKWVVPTYAEDKKLDEEILGMFDNLPEALSASRCYQHDVGRGEALV